MNPPVPPGPEPVPDPPEPVDTMTVKIKNSTNADVVFAVRAYTGTASVESTDQRKKMGYNEEHTFSIPIGSNTGILVKSRNYSSTYPDISDAFYSWNNLSQVKWKINLADTATFYVAYANGDDFSGTYDATQNYATQS